MHPDEIAWIKAHAAAYAAQYYGVENPSEAQIAAARQRLTREALREVDVLWSAMLGGPDRTDPRAGAFLATAEGEFVNESGHAQQLFTVEGNQRWQPLVFMLDADVPYYRANVHGGVNSDPFIGLNQEIGHALGESGSALAAHPWWVVTSPLESLWTLAQHPIDTSSRWFRKNGQTLGESARGLDGYTRSKMNAIYGQDVTWQLASIEGINVGAVVQDVRGTVRSANNAVGMAQSGVRRALMQEGLRRVPQALDAPSLPSYSATHPVPMDGPAREWLLPEPVSYKVPPITSEGKADAAQYLRLKERYAAQDSRYESLERQISEVSTFKAKGVDETTADRYLSKEGKNYLNQLRSFDSEANMEDLRRRGAGHIRTGTAIPEMENISSPLVKIVPHGESVSPYSPFFTTIEHLKEVEASGKTLADAYGLPLRSESIVYDIYQIKPKKPNTLVFRSQIAPTTELGGKIVRSGGVPQYLVPDRNLWTEPEKITTNIIEWEKNVWPMMNQKSESIRKELEKQP